ncbi:hypothetical protein AVEN_171978-1 [Araneus ventricosus]|uniref:Uncharacterized protein n=1 Tax=Araneus ventricosus TaxID=182803 RepID=A0A4Y2J4S8_ARAVE|nr:hypothetical protein AVEN_171978-1 [Araneus ventricosus]
METSSRIPPIHREKAWGGVVQSHQPLPQRSYYPLWQAHAYGVLELPSSPVTCMQPQETVCGYKGLFQRLFSERQGLFCKKSLLKVASLTLLRTRESF